jgi:hypothetical protein
VSTNEAYLSPDGTTWTHIGHLDDPIGDLSGPADFTGLDGFLDTLQMRIPSPLERAMAILAPHLTNEPRYQPRETSP